MLKNIDNVLKVGTVFSIITVVSYKMLKSGKRVKFTIDGVLHFEAEFN